MDPVDDDLREYHAIQRWLAGEKPPAAGRTWRRPRCPAFPMPALEPPPLPPPGDALTPGEVASLVLGILLFLVVLILLAAMALR